MKTDKLSLIIRIVSGLAALLLVTGVAVPLITGKGAVMGRMYEFAIVVVTMGFSELTQLTSTGAIVGLVCVQFSVYAWIIVICLGLASSMRSTRHTQSAE